MLPNPLHHDVSVRIGSKTCGMQCQKISFRTLFRRLLLPLPDVRMAYTLTGHINDWDGCDFSMEWTNVENMPERDNLEDILEDLRHEQPEIRQYAIQRLEVYSFRAYDEAEVDSLEAADKIRTRLLQDPRVVDALLIAIGDPSARIRGGAALLLGHGETLEGQDALLRHLQTDPTDSVRKMCAMALGHTPNTPQKLEGYLSALRAPDYQIVFSACINLGKIGEKKAVEPLRAILTHSSWKMRFRACEVVNLLEALNRHREAEEHNEMIRGNAALSAKFDPQAADRDVEAGTTQGMLEKARRALQ